MNVKFLKWGMNVWPPFMGAGIRVKHIESDYSEVVVEMNLCWYNRNYVSTHFGGSLYAMADPFYMLMMLNILGKEYIVWDKAASIDFVSPGKGKVRARFTLTNEQIEDVKKHTANGEKYTPEYTVDLVDEKGNLVAKVTKRLYIKKKKLNSFQSLPKPQNENKAF